MNRIAETKRHNWRTRIAIGCLVFLTATGAFPAAYAAAPAAGGQTLTETDTTIQKTAAYLMKTVTDPTVNSVGGEWTVIGLARADKAPAGLDAYTTKYYANASAFLKQNKGVLTSSKYTEYSRMILAMNAIGKTNAAVAGYDLFANICDFSKVKKQGLNGPVYALIAIDSCDYVLPTTTSAAVLSTVSELTTRDGLIKYILAKELPGGGFALGGTAADPDVTAMVLQALARYKDTEEVGAAIDQSLSILSQMQDKNGRILSAGIASSESTAQTILALTALGINPETDSRFTKTDADGKSNGLVTGLLSFGNTDGSFRHLTGGTVDLMATEQSFLALVAYERFLNDEPPLFQMTDTVTNDISAADSQYKVTVNGEYLTFDQEPVLQNARLLVPLRAIFEALGADVSWDNNTKKVTATKGDRVVTLTIGETIGYVNNTAVTLEAPAILKNGNTMVPLRFVSEALAAEVTWDPNTKTASIVQK